MRILFDSYVNVRNLSEINIIFILVSNINQSNITFDIKLHLWSVWGQPIEGIDCGKEAEEWFSQYLQKPGTKLIQHIPQLLMRKSGAQVNNNIVKLKEFPVSNNF